MITLLALIFQIANIMQFVPYDGSSTLAFPAYNYYFGVFCVLMYQTLDAVDGKQARRTK